MVVEMLLPGHMHCGGCYWSEARKFEWFREEQADDGAFPVHSSVSSRWLDEISQTGFAQSTLNGKWLTKVVSRNISYGYVRQHEPPDGLLYRLVEGDRLKTLFTILLEKLDQFHYIERMEVPVKKSKNANEFHRAYWTKFMKHARVPRWVQMTARQRRRHLWEWMFVKFSVDSRNIRMVPRGWPDDQRGVKRKRDGRMTNEACWDGFWLDDFELDQLVDEVCRVYEEHTRLDEENL